MSAASPQLKPHLYGRRPVLIGGWLIALPVPAMLAWGPAWGWIVAANILLGASQGLTWSTTVIMEIDLAGPGRRGLAMRFNEAAGYVAVAATSLATGAIAAHAGLRPELFLLGAAYAALTDKALPARHRTHPPHLARRHRRRRPPRIARPRHRRLPALARRRHSPSAPLLAGALAGAYGLNQ
ncbi:MFS transporter [Streptomyces sp. ISL-86]|nr:MFS transporter [Streptomyces sp. ISL-86]